MYNRKGQPRHAIWLIETVDNEPILPEYFSEPFDEAAQLLSDWSGHPAGFIIDPKPLTHSAPHYGPEPEEMKKRDGILAVNPFNNTMSGLKIEKENQISEAERLEYAEWLNKKWAESGIPYYAPIIPGYDAHIVFPNLSRYGFHNDWLQHQKWLALQYATGGLSVDCWNGWTEGYGIPPTRQDGDRITRWATDVIQTLKGQFYGAQMGDVNGDGKISADDVVIVLQVSVGLKTVEGMEQKVRSDVNNDSVVNVSDAIKVLRMTVGIT